MNEGNSRTTVDGSAQHPIPDPPAQYPGHMNNLHNVAQGGGSTTNGGKTSHHPINAPCGPPHVNTNTYAVSPPAGRSGLNTINGDGSGQHPNNVTPHENTNTAQRFAPGNGFHSFTSNANQGQGGGGVIPGYNLQNFAMNGGNMNMNCYNGTVNQDYRCQGGLQEETPTNSDTARNDDSKEKSNNTALPIPNTVNLGRHRLPQLPNGLIPVSRKTISARDDNKKNQHLSRYWHYYWMFDPSHQRTESPTMVEQDDQAMSIFERSVINIHDEIKKEAMRILKAKIVHNCQSSGLTLDGQTITNFGLFRKYLQSDLMMKSFQRNVKMPFAATMNMIFRHTTESQMSEWFYPALQDWARNKRSLPFDFECKTLTTDNVESLHTIIRIGTKACQSLYDGVHDLEMNTFGMSMRMRKISSNSKLRENHHHVDVDLTDVNPSGIKTYILVNKIRHPQFVNRPTEEELNASPRDPMYYHAYMMAQGCKGRGLTRDKSIDCLEVALRSVFNDENGVVNGGNGSDLTSTNQQTPHFGNGQSFPYHNGFNASSTRESPHFFQNHNVQPTTHDVGENNAQMSGFDTHQEKNIGQNQLNSAIDDCWDDLMRPPSPLVRSSFIDIS